MTVMGSETRVAYVLDKSGSMTEHWQAAMDGANQYMAALLQQDPETRVSITFFDNEVYPVINNIPVREVTELTSDVYVPDGTTALYDAVGSAIASMDAQTNPGDIVLVAIFTDGYENASVEFSRYTQPMISRTNRNRRASPKTRVGGGNGSSSRDGASRSG